MTEPKEGETARMGRPTLYTEELAEFICNLITQGFSLRQICDQEFMPDRGTVIRWLAAHETFATKYAHAREEQAELMDDRILEVANKTEEHKMDPKAASVVIAALQWRAAKLKPKKYGDTKRMEHTGADGGPILVAPARRTEIFARLIEHTGAEPKPDEA